MPRKIAAGNWKMNGTTAALAEIDAIAQALPDPSPEVILCPPATLIAAAATHAQGTGIAIGAQDCHAKDSGAHTGDISAAMILDAGGSCVILGHSERRTDHIESDIDVARKVTAAQTASLLPIVCIGESLTERKSGRTLEILDGQLTGSLPEGCDAQNLVIAYEPIWAIGSGLTASPEQIADVHAHIRARLAQRFGSVGADIALLYGGSVKAANAAEIFAVEDVDGALVGGASLRAEDFVPIINALGAA